MRSRRPVALVAALALPWLAAGCASDSGAAAAGAVAPAPRASALPSAQSIIDRYIAAIGGRDAIMRHEGYRARGTFEMPGAGLRGDLELVHAKPNRMAMKITVPGLGEILTGFDGTVAWSVNPIQGPRLLEGKELAQTRDEASFENWLRGGSTIVSRETVERAEMAGEPCYRVKIVFQSGAESFDCYSIATGLLIGTRARRDMEMGTIESTTLMENYRDFGGVKYPARTRIQLMGQEQILTITSLEFGPVDAAAFAQPPQIQALVKQRGGSPD